MIYNDIVIGKLKNQWVISADNGFLSMLADSWDAIYKVNPGWFDVNDLSPEKNVFTKIAANIFSGVDVNTFAQPATPKLEFDSLKPVIIDAQIRASIVHVSCSFNSISKPIANCIPRANNRIPSSSLNIGINFSI